MRRNRVGYGAQLALWAIGLVCVVSFFAWVLIWFFPSWSCEQRWKDSGKGYRYEVFVGCKVENTPGKWVIDRYIRSEGE